jgi:hypothetical protein
MSFRGQPDHASRAQHHERISGDDEVSEGVAQALCEFGKDPRYLDGGFDAGPIRLRGIAQAF